MALTNQLDSLARLFASLGVIVALMVAIIQYRAHRLKQAEWLKALFEKFYEGSTYKQARRWLDYDQLQEQLTVDDTKSRQDNEETFTNFLNFFEFIGVLYTMKHLTFRQINSVFAYYLKKIKSDECCRQWIMEYNFEQLSILIDRVD